MERFLGILVFEDDGWVLVLRKNLAVYPWKNFEVIATKKNFVMKIRTYKAIRVMQLTVIPFGPFHFQLQLSLQRSTRRIQ